MSRITCAPSGWRNFGPKLMPMPVTELVMPLGPTLIIDLMAGNGASLKLALPRAGAPPLVHGMPVRVRVKPGANPSVFLGTAG